MIHRDLKPGNLFIANGVVKIGDFGLATVKTDAQKLISASGKDSFQDSSLTSDIGTPVYCAPETLLTGKYTNAVDMFSIGIVFFEMVYIFKVKPSKPRQGCRGLLSYVNYASRYFLKIST